MEIKDIIIVVLLILYPLIIFIYRTWIENKIKYSVKKNYDELLENYKRELEIKNKASLMADLLSEWLCFPEKQQRLNQLSFEAFLWLPKEITKDLSNLLAHKPAAKNVRQIISDVRNHLLTKDQQIDPNDIIVFTQENKTIIEQKKK
jgi:hypothetical protein